MIQSKKRINVLLKYIISSFLIIFLMMMIGFFISFFNFKSEVKSRIIGLKELVVKNYFEFFDKKNKN